jgi:hypothetical protein
MRTDESQQGRCVVLLKKQVTAFLTNEPGALARVAKALAAAKVNIEGISVLENTDSGQVRMIVSSANAAVKALKRAGIGATVQTVAVLSLKDRPGALAQAAGRLAAAGVNINYVYGTACQCGCDCACNLVVSASDLKKVQSVA